VRDHCLDAEGYWITKPPNKQKRNHSATTVDTESGVVIVHKRRNIVLTPKVTIMYLNEAKALESMAVTKKLA